MYFEKPKNYALAADVVKMSRHCFSALLTSVDVVTLS